MTSWIKSVWCRRIVLAVLLVVAWPVWRGYSTYQENRTQARLEKTAMLMAEIWVATSQFRVNPENYLSFRDSLLKSRNVTPKSIEREVSELQDTPKRQLAFFQRVSKIVDSLIAIEDSLISVSIVDSVSVADSVSTADSVSIADSQTVTDSVMASDSSTSQ